MPLMTGRGTFLIAGQEKVVTGCLQATSRSEWNDLTTRRLLRVGEQLGEALERALVGLAGAAAVAEAHVLAAVAEAVTGFFAHGQFVRAADDTNPLAFISQVRRVSQVVPGTDPGYEARCVHATHLGRLCLLETPEGDRIGVNLGLAVLADVDSQGRLLTPYVHADAAQAVEFLPPEADGGHILGDLANPDCRQRYAGGMLALVGEDLRRIDADGADLLLAHPAQPLGASASLIPLLAHDDPNRALMGTNMQRQAVALLTPQAPLVGTGMEGPVARDSGSVMTADCAGIVAESTPERVVIQPENGAALVFPLPGWRSPQGTPQPPSWQPLVRPGDRVAQGQSIAGGPGTDQGVLALGRNVLVGYMPWEGYNFEDGIVVSDRVVREGHFDSVKVHEFTLTVRDRDLERLSRQHLPAALTACLDPDGIVQVGAQVQGGDILVSRARPTTDGGLQDASLCLPAGPRGTVVRVEHYHDAAGDRLAPGVMAFIRIRIACRRPLQVGDKLCNRHGAKGVVALVLPEVQMPMLADGRRLEMLMDPLGVPSRMNLGAVLEAHLGMAAHELGCTVVTPGFNGIPVAQIEAMLVEAGLPASGMFHLTDSRTGRPFEQETTVGYVYMMKLDHMAADKRQERHTGPYLADSGQPTSGRRDHGGQRVGIMETWALQGHGVAEVLRQMLTIKSDDPTARAGVYEALVRGSSLPTTTVPHSVRRLVLRLRGLCLDLGFSTADGSPVDLSAPDASVDAAVAAALALATPERVLAWSSGEVCASAGQAVTPETVRDGACLSLRHIPLSLPVRHPWREFLGEAAMGMPAITVLPVLPASLCPGRRFDELYAAVLTADTACRRSGNRSDTAERLQRAVDQLLSALTTCLHGKHGWITEALSGKTVDYSGRAVVCPGPELDYDTCSLPEPMAMTLLEPLVCGALVRSGTAASPEQARMMLTQRHPSAMETLRRLAAESCVILHRAPVLHRVGMQAFRMRVAPEDVIRVHPLTLVAFNADFDGDEMDAFLPLGDAAQAEAWDLARSSRCQLSPANGGYLAALTQDMVFGCFYVTCTEPDANAEAIAFPDLPAVAEAYAAGRVGVHASVVVGDRRTTVGRALLNQLLPPALGWFEGPATKGSLQALLARAWQALGPRATAALADQLMRFGFRHATLSGASLGKDTFRQLPTYRACLEAAWETARRIAGQHSDDPVAGRDALVAHWVQVTDRMAADALAELAADRHGMNPLHLMLVSGARGSRLQVRQHLAMRGLLALPDSRILTAPVTTSFIRGHSPLEYLAATFGARRGLADTALKTAEAGSLFKRIMGAVQDVVIDSADCGSTSGVVKAALGEGSGPWLRLSERIAGRTALSDVAGPAAGAEVLVRAGEIISPEQARAIEAAGVTSVPVRSAIGCRAAGGICAACYGLDLASGRLPRERQAIGVVAAQSIGEPATQLTMRTFHPGAAPSQAGRRDDIVGGIPRLDQLFEVWSRSPESGRARRREVEDVYARSGAAAAAECLLSELQRVYREQGVRIDDRHFEVVLSRMVSNGLRGVTEVAAQSEDFIVAGTAYGGIRALACAAVCGRRIELNTIRRCTLLGKRIPAPREA